MKNYNSLQREIWITEETYKSMTRWEKIRFWVLVACSGTIVYKTTEKELKKKKGIEEFLNKYNLDNNGTAYADLFNLIRKEKTEYKKLLMKKSLSAK